MLGQPWILQLKQDYNISVEAGFRIGDHMESSMPLSEYNFGKFNQRPSLTIKAGPLFSTPLSCSPHSESSPSHWSTSSSDTTLWLSFSSYTSLTPFSFLYCLCVLFLTSEYCSALELSLRATLLFNPQSLPVPGWKVVPKKTCLLSNPWKLWILLYFTKEWIWPYIAKDVIKDFERGLSWITQMNP